MKKRMKLKDKIIAKIQPQIQAKVDLFEKNIVIDCCNRIYFLLDKKIDNDLLNSVILDLQNGGYKLKND